MNELTNVSDTHTPSILSSHSYFLTLFVFPLTSGTPHHVKWEKDNDMWSKCNALAMQTKINKNKQQQQKTWKKIYKELRRRPVETKKKRRVKTRPKGDRRNGGRNELHSNKEKEKQRETGMEGRGKETIYTKSNTFQAFESIVGLTLTMAHSCRKKQEMTNRKKKQTRGCFRCVGCTTHRPNKGSLGQRHGTWILTHIYTLTDTHVYTHVFQCVSIIDGFRTAAPSNRWKEGTTIVRGQLRERRWWEKQKATVWIGGNGQFFIFESHKRCSFLFALLLLLLLLFAVNDAVFHFLYACLSLALEQKSGR